MAAPDARTTNTSTRRTSHAARIDPLSDGISACLRRADRATRRACAADPAGRCPAGRCPAGRCPAGLAAGPHAGTIGFDLAPVCAANGRPASELPIDKLKVPAGFKVEVWADGIPEARSLALGDKGTVFVSNRLAKNV